LFVPESGIPCGRLPGRFAEPLEWLSGKLRKSPAGVVLGTVRSLVMAKIA
jgi:hypothetical protein